MQKNILYCEYTRAKENTVARTIANVCYQALVLSIALPLACSVVLAKGLCMFLRQLATISFACCVWIFLASVVVLFILALTVHLAVASVG